MKRYILVFLLFISTHTAAVELSGVKMEESVQMGNHQLVLNGAGIRTKFVVKVYVVGLYLGKKEKSEEAILADRGAKRIALQMVRDVSSKLFFDGLNASILANHNEAEMKILDPKVDKLLKFISTIPELKKGETLSLDYLPGQGTRIVIDGKDRGEIEGQEFYSALLKIWIGHKPVNKQLKQVLLGDETEKL